MVGLREIYRVNPTYYLAIIAFTSKKFHAEAQSG
jgi:hypothetical protein